MANHKLSILQRTHDVTGWHTSAQFEDPDIKNIKVLNTRNDKSLNAIPSPLARLHLFDAAFSLVYQDELQGSNYSGDAYQKLVSDCFDVFELIFNWNNHIREKKDLKIVPWNREAETNELKKEFIADKEKKEAELRKSQDPNKSLNLQQINGFKEHLVGETLNLFLQTGVFKQFNEIHIITLDDKPIAGTSPLTGFFTTPNDLGNLKLTNPISKRPYFSKHLPFVEREPKIKRFIYEFFVSHGSSLFKAEFPISKYMELHSGSIRNIALQLEPLQATSNSIFNETIVLQSNRERGVFDYFENHIIRVNYRINDECFYGAINSKKDRKHDYLLPLTSNFFVDFELNDISSKVTINEKDSNTVEVTIKKDNQILSKTYQSNRIEDQDGYLIDLAETYSIKMDLGIFPFLKVTGDEAKLYNDYYRVIFVSQDNNYQYSNDDFKINFGKDREIIIPDNVPQFEIAKENRTILEKDKTLVGSAYYSLNFCFDFLQIEFPQVSGSTIRGVVVPKWNSVSIGDGEIDFAIDFGTTTTFVAYKGDPKEPTKPQPLVINEPHKIVALLNKQKERKAGNNLIDCFEHHSVLPDFPEFFEVQKQEFVPSLISSEKYSLPFRTAMYEKNSIAINQKKSLFNSNIAFAYQKEDNNVTALNQDYITNLKWNVDSNPKIQESINVFIEELFQILKLKTILLKGNPKLSKVSWFSPLSFTEGAQFTYNIIWGNKYEAVFKGDKSKNLKNITESEAPFYYYSRIMKDASGAERIADPASVITLDIGGGTTDLMYFENGNPQLGTSVHFGANILWGNAYSEVDSEKFNGIYQSLRETITNKLKSTELKALNEKFTNPDSAYSSDEIINFWLLNNNKSQVIDELKKGDFKFSYLLHLSSLIYHSCKLLKAYNKVAPTAIVFTGNGSKYLDLIQTKEYIELICGFFIKEIFGSDAKNPQVVLPAANRKEATCFGGLYQPFDVKRQFTAINYLGYENSKDTLKKYSEIDIRKEQFFDSLENSFIEFINCFFKMNERTDLSFRKHFTIEKNLTALKNFILSKTRENLSTGFEKRRKLVDAGDDITDSPFFYPLVGLIYHINNLSKKTLNDFIPKTTYFALSPDGENSFDASRFSTEQKTDSIFTISIDNTTPDFGEISLIADSTANKRAMAGINGFLQSVCEFKEFPDDANQNIEVISAGNVAKDKETGKWIIVQKIQIQFVS